MLIVSPLTFSGLLGLNLTKGTAPTELTAWYGADGPSLLERIDGLQPPERSVDKPLRLCVSDIFKGMGSGICVSGKIEAGILTLRLLRVGARVYVSCVCVCVCFLSLRV